MTMYNIALLENIHPQASTQFRGHRMDAIQVYNKSLEGAELKEVLKNVQILGIRSKTEISRGILDAAPNLIAIGCFCIGTDQVDLQAAKEKGIAVFNAPYANTRSVAELVLGEAIMLMRRIPEKDKAAHRGEWFKAVDGASEVRGKTLGIVGYGHIGTQLSVLAESIGMRVVFYDIVDKLALGNATRCTNLNDLLRQSDIVTLHVPATDETENMIGTDQLKLMKTGSFLINASRGAVVDIDALAHVVKTQHLAGAAIDVFPVEPSAKGDIFHSPLQNLPNVILTPHIGGSTLEAQENIALDVTDKLLRYVLHGSTSGSVNMPQVTLPAADHNRFRHFHHNVPGVLAQINEVFSSRNLNIAAQYLQTDKTSGYVVIDSDSKLNREDILKALSSIPGTICAL
jgi:D-3-phosphoglycerate dehydrogenase / 2-oxoglutarate reductase